MRIFTGVWPLGIFQVAGKRIHLYFTFPPFRVCLPESIFFTVDSIVLAEAPELNGIIAQIDKWYHRWPPMGTLKRKRAPD